MLSREAGFLLNNWAFGAILMVVFWGTLFPVFSEAVTGERVAVAPPLFHTLPRRPRLLPHAGRGARSFPPLARGWGPPGRGGGGHPRGAAPPLRVAGPDGA